VPGFAIREADAALMVGHDAVAGTAQRCEIPGLLVEQVLVGAVMRLDGDALAAVVAKTTAESCGLKFRNANRMLAPLAAGEVFS
jgi:hypothetical protein